jgi:hypothetical protein
MTPEEKLNACNHLRRQICNELLRLEAFRQEVNRPGFSGGNIIIANTNGQMSVYRIYPTDDMQDVLDFAEMLSRKRITNMQELLKQIQEE